MFLVKDYLFKYAGLGSPTDRTSWNIMCFKKLIFNWSEYSAVVTKLLLESAKMLTFVQRLWLYMLKIIKNIKILQKIQLNIFVMDVFQLCTTFWSDILFDLIGDKRDSTASSFWSVSLESRDQSSVLRIKWHPLYRPHINSTISLVKQWL